MKGSSLNIEKRLTEDAENIFIDEDFKKNLKKQMLSMDKRSRYSKYSRPRYLKAASIVAIIAITSTSVFGVGSVYTERLAASRLQESETKKAALNLNSMAALQSSQEDIGLIKNNITKVQNESSSENKSGKTGNISGAETNTDTKNIGNTNKSTEQVKPSGNTGIQNGKSSGSSGSQNSGTKVNTANPASNSGTLIAASTGKKDETAQTNKAGDSTEKVEKVETTLKMVSGKYMISSIKAEKSETVSSLPEEYGSLKPQDSLQLPLANNEKIAFEKEGNIYMVKPSTKKVVTVDSGKAPEVYEAINLVSYIKEEPSKEENKPAECSVWVFDGNSAAKYNMLTCSDGKYTYINTFWSQTGKELYVLAHNNFTGNYEIMKLTLSII